MRSKYSWLSSGWRKIFILFGALLALVFAAALIMVRVSPEIGAVGSDVLRGILGDEAVAQMEAVLFKIDDTLMGLEYHSGLTKASPPWAVTPAQSAGSAHSSTFPSVVSVPATPPPMPMTGLKATPANGSSLHPSSNFNLSPSQNLLPTPSPAPSLEWSQPSINPLGNLPGEGIWSPYIPNTAGQVLAEKTFLQPDPNRPYALVAVVAFDLNATQLHFVIGYQEPYAQPDLRVRSKGVIPESDLAPGVLVAAFNGGFKYRNGHFGAMSGGLVSAPPQPGLATVAITSDGQVRLGAWGTDLSSQDPYIAYRQNGPLALHDGKITQQVADSFFWGYTISSGTVTWRSGLGISRDGNTLYYFAGPYLTINTLTRVMVDVGVWNAMQLDINNYWVVLYAFRDQGNGLVPEALFPKEMAADANRFLRPYARDFFYITAR